MRLPKPEAVTFALAFALGLGGCDAPKQEWVAPQAKADNAPSVVEQVPADGPQPFAIQLASGKWCHGEADETFFNGNDRLCSTIRNIRLDEEVAAPYRRATMKLTYHQPGPVTGDGKTVGWNETDMRINCETGEMWVLDITTYGPDGAVILKEPQNPPRMGPTGPDVTKIVCSAAL